MNQKNKKVDLERILKMQRKGKFFHETEISPEIYVSAADKGYSTIKLRSGEMIFYFPSESIIEDPESPFKGNYKNQVPKEPIAYYDLRNRT